MELKFKERDDGITYVALVGDLDHDGAAEIETEFMACVAALEKPTIVDLSEVGFLGSPGIQMLLVAEKSLKRVGAGMVLLKPQGLVEETLKTAKLHRIFHILHDEDRALEVLQS